MQKYRSALPQLGSRLFLSDGGLETTLIFHSSIQLPYFASFDLMRSVEGRNTLRKYYVPYIETALRSGLGFILESPTWRANPDWAAKLGYSAEALAEINQDAISLMTELRDAHETSTTPMVISGCIGPRGDGYVAGEEISPEAASDYHSQQIRTFALSDADMIAAFTMTNVNEALGIARAAQHFKIPSAISFTLETNGRLPTGQSLKEAIQTIDQETSQGPAYYMINCAHPTHFASIFDDEGDWISRVRGIRANASKRSHAELDEAPDLDDGNPSELGEQYRGLLARAPQVTVVGGCCGTDHRHVTCISAACGGSSTTETSDHNLAVS